MVLRCDSPVKGLRLLTGGQYMLVGLDNGQIKVVDKLRLSELSQQTFAAAPVLKIDQILQAVLI